jgi:hypothetical protein
MTKALKSALFINTPVYIEFQSRMSSVCTSKMKSVNYSKLCSICIAEYLYTIDPIDINFIRNQFLKQSSKYLIMLLKIYLRSLVSKWHYHVNIINCSSTTISLFIKIISWNNFNAVVCSKNNPKLKQIQKYSIWWFINKFIVINYCLT